MFERCCRLVFARFAEFAANPADWRLADVGAESCAFLFESGAQASARAFMSAVAPNAIRATMRAYLIPRFAGRDWRPKWN